MSKENNVVVCDLCKKYGVPAGLTIVGVLGPAREEDKGRLTYQLNEKLDTCEECSKQLAEVIHNAYLVLRRE